MRGQKGITLVALVISIIILLILATVTIVSINSDGMMSHAQNAATRYDAEADAEEDKIENFADRLDYIEGELAADANA